MIVAYSDGYRERFGVEPICAVLSEHGMTIAPSTYYVHKAAPVSQAALAEAYLVNALVTLWQQNWRARRIQPHLDADPSAPPSPDEVVKLEGHVATWVGQQGLEPWTDGL